MAGRQRPPWLRPHLPLAPPAPPNPASAPHQPGDRTHRSCPLHGAKPADLSGVPGSLGPSRRPLQAGRPVPSRRPLPHRIGTDSAGPRAEGRAVEEGSKGAFDGAPRLRVAPPRPGRRRAGSRRLARAKATRYHAVGLAEPVTGRVPRPRRRILTTSSAKLQRGGRGGPGAGLDGRARPPFLRASIHPFIRSSAVVGPPLRRAGGPAGGMEGGRRGDGDSRAAGPEPAERGALGRVLAARRWDAALSLPRPPQPGTPSRGAPGRPALAPNS